MKVSIVVPVYNVADCIIECIDSLVGQTLDDCEIILVNDGSTDESGKICEAYAQKYTNIKLITQENSGQSAARNNGVRYATGEYVLFVDSDDYITANACETLYAAAKKYNADIVVGDMLNERERIESDPEFRYIPGEYEPLPVREYSRRALAYNVYDIVPWIRLVRRSYLENNGMSFLEGCFYEDQEYSMHLMTLDNGYAVKIRFPFYYYRMQRPGSTTTHTSPKKGRDLLRVIERMQDNLSQLDDEAKPIGTRILGIAYYHFADLWLKLDKASRREQHKEFLALVNTECDAKKAIEGLNEAMASKVKGMISSPRVTYLRFRVKKLIKRMMGR